MFYEQKGIFLKSNLALMEHKISLWIFFKIVTSTFISNNSLSHHKIVYLAFKKIFIFHSTLIKKTHKYLFLQAQHFKII